MADKGIIGKIVDDIAENTRAVHEINKENFAAVKADTKANFKNATVPDPGFEKFMQAKGIGNKAKVVVENIRESAKENSDKEKARRAEIQSNDPYRTVLEDQRTGRQDIITHPNEGEGK